MSTMLRDLLVVALVTALVFLALYALVRPDGWISDVGGPYG